MTPSQFFKGRTVLVTGGAGAIGSNLVTSLLTLPVAKVHVLDDLTSAVPWNLPEDDRLVLQVGSVCDPLELKQAFADRPTVVFHL
ncbi:MAG: NAD-dependent epimerase/dehydratase family protein, partial [Anaerolineae bacterium]|nr:NAD-dependent epimerase/dehydratase family protein [Anaerolineae bacterium]